MLGIPDDVDAGPDGRAVTARRFREALGRFASGVCVVTALSEGRPVGLTCQSFTSVSLDPPLVLFVPARTSRTWPVIERTGSFCVNVLAADQGAVAHTMAGRGTDKFAGLDWAPSAVSGSPVLADAIAHVDCRLHAVHDGGDHVVVLGRVLELAAAPTDRDPLLYFRGAYRTLGP